MRTHINSKHTHTLCARSAAGWPVVMSRDMEILCAPEMHHALANPTCLVSGSSVPGCQVGAATSAAPAGRYVLYVTTVQPSGLAASQYTQRGSASGETAAECAAGGGSPPAALTDVVAALAALTDLPAGGQLHMQPGSGAATDPAASAGPPQQPSAAANGVSGDIAGGRPQALLLVSFSQTAAVPPQVSPCIFSKL